MQVELGLIDFDFFKHTVYSMPTQWLLRYHAMLHLDNDEYHKLIDIILDIDNQLTEDSVVDKQIECLNRMLYVMDILTYRGVKVPGVTTLGVHGV